MDEEKVQEILNNVSANLLLFPPVINGMIPFCLEDNVFAYNNKINLSIALSIKQKKLLNEILSLKIMTYDHKSKIYKTLKLKDINLNENNQLEHLNFSRIEISQNEDLGEGYTIRKNYTFYFNQVPINKLGRYAIALVIDGGSKFKSITSYYFDVKDAASCTLGSLN